MAAGKTLFGNNLDEWHERAALVAERDRDDQGTAFRVGGVRVGVEQKREER